MNRSAFLWVVVAGALGAGCSRGVVSTTPGSCRDCNVVLITIDTLRPDHMTLAGYARDTTPNIARFFGDQSWFTEATSPAPCTLPAVKQLLSGTLSTANQRLAEVLKTHGYRTAAVVSQHLFYWFGKMGEYSRGFDYWDIQNSTEVDQHGLSTRSATEVTSRAIGWLQHKGQRGKFFLWLHYFDPHDPYEPPERFRLFDPSGSAPTSGDRRTPLQQVARPAWLPWQRAGAIFDQNQVRHLVALYDGELRYVDEEVGRLLQSLSDLDLVDHTVVVLSSDHGERLGEDNAWDHCLSLHQREIRVPLLVSVRGNALAGVDPQAPVSTLDIYPTVLDLLGISLRSKKLVGRSLFDNSPQRAVLSVFMYEAAIRHGEWKLYARRARAGYDPTRLIRLGASLDEEANLVRDRPEVTTRLLKELSNFLDQVRAAERSSTNDITELKALGYL